MADTQKKSSCAKGGAKNCHANIITPYLIGYNAIQTIGWTYLLYQLVIYFIFPPTDKSLYETLKWTVIIFQNAAVLEIVHAAIRIVSSNPIITAFQVASRVMVVCGVLMLTNAARETIGLPLALLAWSVTEVIRYANYTLSLLGKIPHFIKFLRYTTFIVLYPIGVTGELLCIYAAQQEIGTTGVLTLDMPNKFNFIFNYRHFLWFIMFLYIPLFPQMYLHMFAQRRKVLGGSNKDALHKK